MLFVSSASVHRFMSAVALVIGSLVTSHTALSFKGLTVQSGNAYGGASAYTPIASAERRIERRGSPWAISRVEGSLRDGSQRRASS